MPDNFERRGPKSLSGLVAKVTGPILKKRGFAEARIVTEWADIVGAEFARQCQPDKLVLGRAGKSGRAEPGVLHIRVPGALAVELQHRGPEIIDRVNGYFGYRAVERLNFVQSPLPRPAKRRRKRAPSPDAAAAIDQTVADVADPEMREVLRSFGRGVHGKHETAKGPKRGA